VPPLDEVADAAPVAATINHGRLIAECPDCRGAEMVWRERPLLLCHSCGNRAIGGKWRRVALPGDLPAIEAELSGRGDAATRNWLPGETPAELRREREERR
jgi:NMD protein affecting ribosome stability and mRNA decay